MGVRQRLNKLRKLVRRLDPNDDPTAEPLSLVAVVVILVLSGVSTYLYLRWKIQPMQDAGHHVAMTAVVTDYSRAGSIYPDIYKPFDYLNTNSLLYLFAGYTGKIIGPSWAYRIWSGSYFFAVPLANLWALRVFGRSAWGAVMAVPLAYNMSFIFGFTNYLFAAPFAILSLPLFYRMFVRPTWRRVLATAIVLMLMFLAHVQVFLWAGVMLFAMTLVGAIIASKEQLFGRAGLSAKSIVTTAALSVVPSLALFARWMWRSRQPLAPDEFSRTGMTAFDWASVRAGIANPSDALANFPLTMAIVKTEDNARFLVGSLVLALTCAALARLHSWKRPPIMELACVVTLSSFFFIPEHAAGQSVIASRQIGFAMWFAAAFFTPVPSRVTRLGRWGVIVASCWLASFFLSYWGKNLRRFQKEEVAGLEAMIAAAPPRKKMHYVNNNPGSNIYPLNTFWHAEKWYMIDKLGQVNENPAWGSQNSIRYLKKYDFHRPTNHSSTWIYDDEIWDNYDIILTHHFYPNPGELVIANQKGELLAKQGTWQLWRSKKHP